MIKDKQGKMLNEGVEMRRCWKDYVEELYDRLQEDMSEAIWNSKKEIDMVGPHLLQCEIIKGTIIDETRQNTRN